MSKKPTRRATKPDVCDTRCRTTVDALGRHVSAIVSAVQSRIDALESRLPPAGPPAEAKPTTPGDVVKKKTCEAYPVYKGYPSELDRDAGFTLRIVAAVCRERAKELNQHQASALIDLAHDCEEEAQ